jgi:TRAP transporter TAXI family solute receptor
MTLINRKSVVVAIAAVLGFSASVVQAQTVAVGTTKSGATGQVAAGVSTIISKHSSVRMRPQPVDQTAKYLTSVNRGTLEFGVSNHSQLASSVRGTGVSKGKAHPNLRMVATLVPVWTGFYVRADAGISSVADLKGKRVAGGFPAAPLPRFVTSAFLATSGLSYDDVVIVPSANFASHWKAFDGGKTDAFIGALGSAVITRLQSSTGRLRLLSFENTPASVRGLQKWMSAAEIVTRKPEKNIVGLEDSNRNVMQLYYTLWANKDVAEGVTYAAAKALYENAKELSSLTPLWRNVTAKRMSRNLGVDYHPGAMKFYKEAGNWKR